MVESEGWDSKASRGESGLTGLPDPKTCWDSPELMTIILQQSWLRILFTTFLIRGVGGKAYPSISSHDMLRVSTAQASLSGTRDMNRGSFLLNITKKVYLGCVPPLANLVKDPLVERHFILDNLVVTG